MDKIAIAGLVAGVIGSVAGIVAAVAAVRAVKYAKVSATQAGLDAVEQNTAKTIEQMTAVRMHIAQVDDHLRIQNDRHDLNLAGERVAITVTGEAWADDVMPLTLTLFTEDFIIDQIELVNEGNFFAGAVPCKRIDQRNYLANIPPNFFSSWHSNGKYQTQGENRTVSVKATLIRGKAQTSKTFAVTTTMAFRGGRKGTSFFNSVNGQC